MRKYKFICLCLYFFSISSTLQVNAIPLYAYFLQDNNDREKPEEVLTNQTVKSGSMVENTRDMINTYNSLIDDYSKSGEFKKAAAIQDKLISYKDSINNIEKGKVLADIQSRFEAIENDKELAIASARNNAQERKIKQQDLQRYIYIIVALSVFIIVIGLLSRLKYMRKKRAELILKSKKIATEKMRAEENEKVKEQFLAKMSHEIRTPMNAIMGITNILRKKKRYKNQEKYLEAIWKSSENLLVILNDIIDLSKLESGKIKIEKVLFKPIDELMKLRELLKFKAEEKGIDLMCELGKEIPETLIGDPIRLNQILVNLVGNAIKFTDKGNVSVSIQLKEITEGKAFIIVKVKDTGIGISPEHIDKIFESFIQADSEITKKYAGTGLGLTISRDLVQLQGGKIWVESEQGRGSAFSFEIAYDLSDTKSSLSNVISSEHNQLKGLHVLLVEDNEFNIMVARDELNEIIEDVIIDQVENGKEAVIRVQEAQYDVVLMDIEMEEMNGYDAARAIRKLEEPKNGVPIIAITASALKADIEKCFEAGMNNHIAKPFSPSELKGKLESIFLNRHA